MQILENPYKMLQYCACVKLSNQKAINYTLQTGFFLIYFFYCLYDSVLKFLFALGKYLDREQLV